MKIPIHKHTPVRRPMSKHVIALRNNAEVLRGKSLKSFLYVETVTDISRVLKRKNWEWVGVPTREPVRLESDNVTTNTFDINLNTFNMLGTTKLGFWQNIKYHIIWWKK